MHLIHMQSIWIFLTKLKEFKDFLSISILLLFLKVTTGVNLPLITLINVRKFWQNYPKSSRISTAGR